MDDYAGKGVNIEGRRGPSRVLISGLAKVVTSKHGIFEQSTYLLRRTRSETARFEEGDSDESDDIVKNVNDETVKRQLVMNHIPTMHREEMHSDVKSRGTQQKTTTGSPEANKVTLKD